MLLIETFAPADAVPVETLTLSFELRAKCRLRTHLDSGEEVGTVPAARHDTARRRPAGRQGTDARCRSRRHRKT
jgi:hypothetical protein